MVESSYGIGKLKGRKEGREEERLHIAINLLDVLDNAAIAKKTGLPLKEIKNLRKKHRH